MLALRRILPAPSASGGWLFVHHKHRRLPVLRMLLNGIQIGTPIRAQPKCPCPQQNNKMPVVTKPLPSATPEECQTTEVTPKKMSIRRVVRRSQQVVRTVIGSNEYALAKEYIKYAAVLMQRSFALVRDHGPTYAARARDQARWTYGQMRGLAPVYASRVRVTIGTYYGKLMAQGRQGSSIGAMYAKRAQSFLRAYYVKLTRFVPKLESWGEAKRSPEQPKKGPNTAPPPPSTACAKKTSSKPDQK